MLHVVALVLSVSLVLATLAQALSAGTANLPVYTRHGGASAGSFRQWR